MLGGTTKENVTQLHDKYGDVVRVSPNEVSFISGETAWQDIYGFRTGQHKGQQNMLKDPVWYPKSSNGAPSLLQSDDEAHSRGRRILSHAFSEKALAGQEPLLQRFVDMLIDELRESAATTDGPQDIADWYVRDRHIPVFTYLQNLVRCAMKIYDSEHSKIWNRRRVANNAHIRFGCFTNTL
jgi:cytochrome P450